MPQLSTARTEGAVAGAPNQTAGRTLLRTPAGLVAVGAILLLGVGLRVTNLENVASRSPDERVYTRQARVVLEKGADGLRELVQESIRDPSLRFYPPPTRAGYIWLLAGVMRISGATDERAGAYLSCAASIASLALLLLFGLRFLPVPAALAAALLFAVSPMELALSRRAWQEAFVGLLGFALVVLAAAIARHPERRVWLLLYAGVGSLGIVIKELLPVAYALVTLQLLYILFVRRKDPRGGVQLLAAGLVGAIAATVWLGTAVGCLSTLWAILSDRSAANTANDYALQYQTGPPWRVLQSFWITAPVASLLCLTGLALLLLSRLRRPALPESPGSAVAEVGWWSGGFLLSFLALPMLLPHWVNLRYFSVTYAPFYLLAGIGSGYLLDLGGRVPGLGRRWVAAAGVAALALTAVADVRFFKEVIVRQGIADLSIKMLLDADFARGRDTPAVAGAPTPAPTTPTAIAAAEAEASRSATPESYLNLSLVYSRAGRHLDAIGACREALKRRPDYAEAYNNIAAAYAELAMWDEAIRAAGEALRLRPDFPLARNNLAWSIAQKKLHEESAAEKQAGPGSATQP